MVTVNVESLFTCGWVIPTILLLCHIMWEAYFHLIVFIVLYYVYKIITRQNVKKIVTNGQGVFITGCDTGFGHDAALRLAKVGFTVFAGCLKPGGNGAHTLRETGGERLHVVPIDVTRDESVSQALKTVKNKMPDTGIWAVINNAGIEMIGDVEFARIETMKRVDEVNYYGMVRVTKAFLPLLRKSRGSVINVTSVKGRLAIPTDVSYISTKWAAEAFSDILRREMHRFGVKVVIIEPGHFGGATAMLMGESLKLAENNVNESWELASPEVQKAYGRKYIDSLITGIQHIGEGGAPNTEPVSDAFQDAVENLNPKCRYLVHGTKNLLDKYCVLAILNQFLPEVMTDYLIRVVFPLPHAAQQIV